LSARPRSAQQKRVISPKKSRQKNLKNSGFPPEALRGRALFSEGT